jgi:hypothetical protein
LRRPFYFQHGKKSGDQPQLDLGGAKQAAKILKVGQISGIAFGLINGWDKSKVWMKCL